MKIKGKAWVLETEHREENYFNGNVMIAKVGGTAGGNERHLTERSTRPLQIQNDLLENSVVLQVVVLSSSNRLLSSGTVVMSTGLARNSSGISIVTDPSPTMPMSGMGLTANKTIYPTCADS